MMITQTPVDTTFQLPLLALLTAESFWEQYIDQHYELVKGVVVAMSPTGFLHQVIAAKVAWILGNYVAAHPTGYVGASEGGYLLARNPDILRAPDASFISFNRLPPGPLPESFISVAPDLAVEIVSPNDRASEVMEKVYEYLTAGTRLVWVIYPTLHEVQVYHADRKSEPFTDGQQLSGEDVLPGLIIEVADLWPIERPASSE